MNKILRFLLPLIIISAFSCQKKQIILGPVVKDTTNKELTEFRTNDIDFKYFQFKSKIEYNDGKNNESFTVNGRIKKDSIIWMSITPGLGIEAARCLIRTDSVFLLDRIHGKLYNYDFSYINKSFNTDLNFYNLQALIVGNLPFDKSQNDKLVKNDNLGFYLLRQIREDIKIDNYVQAANLKLETLDMLNNVNNTSLSIKYGNFAPLDSFLFANELTSVIKIKNSKGEETSTIISIQHTKAEITDKALNFPFNVPKRFEDK